MSYADTDTLTRTAVSTDTINVLGAGNICAQIKLISLISAHYVYGWLMGSVDNKNYVNTDAEGDTLKMTSASTYSIVFPHGTAYRYYYFKVAGDSTFKALTTFRVGK